MLILLDEPEMRLPEWSVSLLDTPLSWPEWRLATLYIQLLDDHLLGRPFGCGLLPRGAAELLSQFYGGRVLTGSRRLHGERAHLIPLYAENWRWGQDLFAHGEDVFAQMQARGLGREGVGAAVLRSPHLNPWAGELAAFQAQLPDRLRRLEQGGDTPDAWEGALRRRLAFVRRGTPLAHPTREAC